MQVVGLNVGLLVAIFFVLALVILQITFGFLMRKNKEAFLKYHRVLGVIILLLIILSAIFFPVISVISALVAIPVLAQVIIGYFLSRGYKGLKKYHRPLGVSISILVIAIIVFIIFKTS